MQTYKQLQEGSYGDEVKQLQKKLNEAGATLDIDGQYGPKTAAAVKQYQSANDLDASGVAGVQTLRHLYGDAQADAQDTQQTIPQATGYTPSDTVEEAKAALDAQAQQRPESYSSAWEQQLEEALDQLLNRESFSYDINADALYQQLQDQYIRQGRLAMEDTLGRAATLTGGYGNSYALTASQLAYQDHLQGLAELAPELRQQAYEAYRQEGQDMLDRYGLMREAESGDYAAYQQAMNAWLNERDYLTGRYDTERGYDYQRYLDEVAQAQWEAEFAENKRRYDLENAPSAGSGNRGDDGDEGDTFSEERIQAFLKKLPYAHAGSSDAWLRHVDAQISKLAEISESNRELTDEDLKEVRKRLGLST